MCEFTKTSANFTRVYTFIRKLLFSLYRNEYTYLVLFNCFRHSAYRAPFSLMCFIYTQVVFILHMSEATQASCCYERRQNTKWKVQKIVPIVLCFCSMAGEPYGIRCGEPVGIVN